MLIKGTRSSSRPSRIGNSDSESSFMPQSGMASRHVELGTGDRPSTMADSSAMTGARGPTSPVSSAEEKLLMEEVMDIDASTSSNTPSSAGGRRVGTQSCCRRGEILRGGVVYNWPARHQPEGPLSFFEETNKVLVESLGSPSRRTIWRSRSGTTPEVGS